MITRITWVSQLVFGALIWLLFDAPLPGQRWRYRQGVRVGAWMFINDPDAPGYRRQLHHD